MNVQPTLEIHPEYHQEIHLASDTESSGCCCFWKSKQSKKEFVFDKNFNVKAVSKANYRQRILANQRLGIILQNSFNCDHVKSDIIFEELKKKINLNNDCSDPLTSERIAQIVNHIYEMVGDNPYVLC